MADEPDARDEQLSRLDQLQDIGRSNFGDMLWDWERNLQYKRAIEKCVGQLAGDRRPTQPLRFLDIGTGSGLLSMFACRAMRSSPAADDYEMIAVEQFEPSFECAGQVLQVNGFRERVQLLHRHSNQLRWQEELGSARADLLVAELYDTDLIGEGALFAYRNALLEQLKPGAIRVPSRARIYVQLIASEYLRGRSRLQPVVIRAGVQIEVQPPVSEQPDCPGLVRWMDLQMNELTDVRPLSEVHQVFEFDFADLASLKLKDCLALRLKLISPPRPEDATALAFWWDSEMDPDGEFLLSCAPYWARFNVDYGSVLAFPEADIVYRGDLITVDGEPASDVSSVPGDLDGLNRFLRDLCDRPEAELASAMRLLQEKVGQKQAWRDHWMQAVHFLPANQPAPMDGDSIKLNAFHDGYDFWFDCNDDRGECVYRARETCHCRVHTPVAWKSRARLLNNAQYQQTLAEGLMQRFPDRRLSVNVLVHSAASYLPVLLARLLPNSRIWVYAGQASRSDFYPALLRANELQGRVTVLADLRQLDAPVDLLIGDPYENMHGLCLDELDSMREHARLVRQRQSDGGRRLRLFPSGGKIRFAIVCLDHLWKLRVPVKQIDGFDLRPFEQMIDRAIEEGDESVETHFLAEYAGVCVQEEAHTAFELDFNVDGQQTQSHTFRLQLDRAQLEHDFVRRFGEDHQDLVKQPLDRLHPFVRSFNNVALCFWTELDGHPSTGPTSALRYLEPVRWSQFFYQGVYFVPEFDSPARNVRGRFEITLEMQLNLDQQTLLVDVQ